MLLVLSQQGLTLHPLNEAFRDLEVPIMNIMEVVPDPTSICIISFVVKQGCSNS